MALEYCIIENSPPLSGSITLGGAKNAVLPIMASLILTSGKSILNNVPASADVYQMIQLLTDLGAQIVFDADANRLVADTTLLSLHCVRPEIMKKMRASVLVMGPLLARHKKVEVALPGGCVIGSRPLDVHLRAFESMGVTVTMSDDRLEAVVERLHSARFVLDYPSVGATENILMAAVLTPGITEIVNAALEPEVVDLINALSSMGAVISLSTPAIIRVEGVKVLHPIEYRVMSDRLEAGTLLLAAAVTGGAITVEDAPADSLELFLQKMTEMGNHIELGIGGVGVQLIAPEKLLPVSFKTMPYPGFPTDLQAPMMAALAIANGLSSIHELVFENRMMHVAELKKMGASIAVVGNHYAEVRGVDMLYGAEVHATDIRASAALIIAGLVAQGKTKMTGVHHLQRGYQGLDKKIRLLGGKIFMHCDVGYTPEHRFTEAHQRDR